LASRQRGLFLARELILIFSYHRKDCFGGTPKPARETRALPGVALQRVE
jgi:hypothetical protein